MTGMAWLRRSVRRMALGLILTASLGAAGGVLVGGPALASGGTGSSPGETGTGTSSCPSPNPPNQLTLVAGTPQTTTLQTAFATGLQVALTNSDGCAVTGAAGAPVTFSAPTAGASGVFSGSSSNTVTVGAEASGSAAAPTFTVNDTSGSYTLTASSQYGSVSFSLTNTGAGIPATITAVSLRSQSASVTGRYHQPLQVRVLDANGNPVAGTSVTFTLGTAAAGACGTTTPASASFAGGGGTATVTTEAGGLATSPALTANTAAGSFPATAVVSSGGGKESNSASSAASPSATPVGFSLANLAGKPAKIAPGVGSTQTTPAGTAFPIRLAVTVTDAYKNPVPDARVAFSAPAPAAGASGRFITRSRGSRHHRRHVSYAHTVTVETSACGVAVAPPFTASRQPGGYIVKASVKPARPAAFALVNEAP
jgi:protocatechuate 3,4-dioxygenase beta subunit